jgi:hypothetical protein
MARPFIDLHIKIVGGPSPKPYKWEIWREKNPIWESRAAGEYSTEELALRAGQAEIDRMRRLELLRKS